MDAIIKNVISEITKDSHFGAFCTQQQIILKANEKSIDFENIITESGLFSMEVYAGRLSFYTPARRFIGSFKVDDAIHLAKILCKRDCE